MENCKRSCSHKEPSIFSPEKSTELGDAIIYKVYLKFNSPSRARKSEVTDPIRPEFELVRDFMPVLVTSKFDEDLIKNERTSLETPFLHFMSMGNFSDAQGHLTL